MQYIVLSYVYNKSRAVHSRPFRKGWFLKGSGRHSKEGFPKRQEPPPLYPGPVTIMDA